MVGSSVSFLSKYPISIRINWDFLFFYNVLFLKILIFFPWLSNPKRIPIVTSNVAVLSNFQLQFLLNTMLFKKYHKNIYFSDISKKDSKKNPENIYIIFY